MFLARFIFLLALLFPVFSQAASPVWKVTAPNGGTLYLGASVHALQRHDSKLPAAFEVALGKSSRLVIESENNDREVAKIMQSGEYARGDSLKNHVDPRTYDYLKRVFTLLGVPETKFAKYRPWLLTLLLWSPDLQGFSSDLGVENRLTKRARGKDKPVSGLVSAREHMNVFVGLTDRQAEAVLLLTFIPTASNSASVMMKAWRRGDVDFLWRKTRAGFTEYPAFGERIMEARNRRWLPKIESYANSGKTAFVVVGSAHLGGPEGLLSLLKKRGYRIEQL